MRDWLAFFTFDNRLAPKWLRTWACERVAGWFTTAPDELGLGDW